MQDLSADDKDSLPASDDFFLYLLQANWTQISAPMRLTQNLTTHAQCL